MDKIKKSFEDKDWKFYCAVAAGLTLAGAGAYYLTSGSSKKGKKKPESKREGKIFVLPIQSIERVSYGKLL